ncbi:MAG: hypothetical protein RIE24_17860 [Silicimonas sp.]
MSDDKQDLELTPLEGQGVSLTIFRDSWTSPRAGLSIDAFLPVSRSY